MLTPYPAHGWASSPERLAIAAAVTVGFAVLARAVRGVNQSGALAGGLACFLLFGGAGPAAFSTLAALFLATWISTRLGYRSKLALGLAERREGRNVWQVLGNLAVAALASVVFSVTGNRTWLVAGQQHHVLRRFTDAGDHGVRLRRGGRHGHQPPGIRN